MGNYMHTSSKRIETKNQLSYYEHHLVCNDISISSDTVNTSRQIVTISYTVEDTVIIIKLGISAEKFRGRRCIVAMHGRVTDSDVSQEFLWSWKLPDVLYDHRTVMEEFDTILEGKFDNHIAWYLKECVWRITLLRENLSRWEEIK
jgi:hypothetical protein